MREHGAEQPNAPWYSPAPLRRLGQLGAKLSGAALLAGGIVNGLAARRRTADDAATPATSNDPTRSRSGGHHRDGQRTRESDQGADGEQKQSRRHADNADDGDAKHRDRHHTHGDHHARQKTADVNSEARGNNNNNNNNNDNNNSGNDGNNDHGGNNHGNAGAGFFDSPLATKARRRAKAFDNQGNQDNASDHNGANANSGGHSGTTTHDTRAIHFTSGPDGIQIDTTNIHYTAPPTPTPTPFPTLQLPARDRLDVFGDRVIPATTPTPAPGGQAPAPTAVPSEPGSSGVVSPPVSTPPPSDTSGGNNSPDFMS